MPNNQAERALLRIASCSDPAQLKTTIRNAHRAGDDGVKRAAELRLYEVLPAAEPGTLQHSVWQSIYALEDALTSERGKTTRLARTRQKIARDGEHKTVSDLILGKKSEGFTMLLDRRLPELTFEAVALLHSEDFDKSLLAAAEKRLLQAGYEPSRFRRAT